MRRFIVINPGLVCALDSRGELLALDDVPRLLGTKKGPVLFAVLPQAVGRLIATERTIDSALPSQFPGDFRFSLDQLTDNSFQVFVLDKELMERLRSMAADVRIIPYPVAVRLAYAQQQKNRQWGLVEMTRVALRQTFDDAASSTASEQVAIDRVGDGMLVTVLRDREVLLARYAEGDPTIELQRTLAGARVFNPTILVNDEELAMELRANGAAADVTQETGAFLGEPGFEKALSFRFMTEAEVAQRSIVERRRRGVLTLSASVGIFLICGVFYGAIRWAYMSAVNEQRALQQQKDTELARLVSLNQERYASVARRESVSLQEEFFDLSTSLPPQVALVSVEKSAEGLSAVVERRPGAAPFSRGDLVTALTNSPYFSGTKISEEYEGHMVRYKLAGPPAPPSGPRPPQASTGSGR